MSVIPSDIRVYGSTYMPEANSLQIGGAVDFSKKIVFTDVNPVGTMDVISTSVSDTTTEISYTDRDTTGIPNTETLTLNGRTWVLGTLTAERILCAAASGASAHGPLAAPSGSAAVGDLILAAHNAIIPASTVTNDESYHTAQAGSSQASGLTPALFKLQSGDGATVQAGQIIWIAGGTGANQARQIISATGWGTDLVSVDRNWGTLPDGTSTYKILQGFLFEQAPSAVTAVIRLFETALAQPTGGSQVDFYEKVFIVNNSTTSAFTYASVLIQADMPAFVDSSLLDIAVCDAFNDTGTCVNRNTLPVNGDTTSLTFVSQPALVAVPGTFATLAPGSAPNAAGTLGVWLRRRLPAGSLSYKGVATLRAMGTPN